MKTRIAVPSVAVLVVALISFGGCPSKLVSSSNSYAPLYRNDGLPVPGRVLIGDMMYVKNEATDPPRRVLLGDGF